MTLLEQAMNIADTTGDIEPAVKARSGLARAQLQLGDPAAALAATAARRELPYPTEEPTMRLLEGLALLELHRAGESVRAFSDALTAADALLALADSNVAALQARALALSGLAAATGDPARATEAGEAFARALLSRAPQAWPQTPAACSTGSPPTTGLVSLPRSAPRRTCDGTRQEPEQLSWAWA